MYLLSQPRGADSGLRNCFSAERCVECGACLQACPSGAVDLQFTGRIHRDKCDRCGKCVEVCPSDGLRTVGKYYEVEALTEILLRDFEYYRHSGGGVTLSGGECTLFPAYLEVLLKSLKAKGVHVDWRRRAVSSIALFVARSIRTWIFSITT